MMNSFDQIKQYTKFENREDIDNFEKALGDLAASGDPEILKKLMDLFDNECPYYEVMGSLVNAVEAYPDEIYVKTLLEKLGDLIKNSPFWARSLVVHVLNSPHCLSLFRSFMPLASEQALLYLFTVIDKESPRHRELVADLRRELAAIKADS